MRKIMNLLVLILNYNSAIGFIKWVAKTEDDRKSLEVKLFQFN